MQARGHQSISPPEQISHSRHGNQVSNTPPPQAAQFYPQAYQQRFEFIPQQQDQSLLQYKAYGSALNEPRAPGNGARVVPPQPNIQQPSGNFYPQATQTMRPPQPQQGPSAQQYFISTPAQPRGIRPQQQMASPTTMVYLPQPTFPGNNVVIPANMYHQRVPQYQPVSYHQYATPNYMYYQPNGWANSGLPQPPANTRPADREKKILSITDPVSGRDVTSEIFSNKNHPTDSDEHRDDTPAMNQSDQEICKTFTRLVADRLKAPDETSSTVDAHITGATPGVVPATTQPSQYQQSASQVQHSQQSVSRSHTRPALIHPAGSATPPQEMPYVDTTIPPPNIRPSATMYNTPQQPHVNSRISQPLQQRPQMAQIIPGQQPSAPNVQVTQATLLPQQSHMPQGLSSDPLNDVASSAPLKLNATKVCERSEPEPSKPDIPAKPVSQVQAVKATPANLDGVQTIQVEELATEDKLPLEPVKEKDVSVSVISQSPDEVVTEELSGSNVSKDGKKNTNNKKKKDINRKEIAGSEMDAFIDDKENETVDTVAKSSTSSPAEEEKQCKDNLTKEVKPASGVGTEIQKAAAKEVITTSGESCDLQSKTVIRLSETEIEKPATFEKSVSPADISPTDSVVDLPQSRIEDVVQNNQIEGSNDLSSSAVDKTYETTIQITKINENEIIKDSILKSHDEGRKISNSADNSANNKTSSESTPLRTDGKETRLQYDRARLMELRDCPISQIKPEGLPNLEIIMDSPNSSSRSTTVAPDFTPNFFQPTTSNQRHPPSMGKTNSRGRQRPGETTRIINIKPNLTNDKPLHQSEKPWKPTQKLVYAGEISEKRKTLESDVLFIMNRLTPTNFDRLAQEMRNLNIQTYEDLTDLVKIFFDKVTMETKFVEAYAQLCKFMSSIKVPPPPGMKENQSTFRVVMLTKCQQEFEADKSIIFEDPEEKKKKIESEMPEGNERNEKIESTLYQMKLKRLKFYGNIRFIGELFKLGMLTENIMHDCIYRLLKARDDDSLVSLCQLLTTVGHVLDTEKAKTRMDQYFNQMAKIAEERKSRIKFTLKDAIDLRSNNWVPRKEQTGPKKIDEVHKDYQQEQYTKQLLQSQPPPPRADTVQPNSRRGSRQRQDELKQSQDDGWNTVGSKSLRIDASKMKLSKNVVDENNIQLGPGGGVSKFSIWGRGSYGGSQPSQEDRPPPSNRFSLLRGGGGGGAGEEDRRNYQKSPSRGDNVASRGIRQAPTAGHGRGKILSRSITEGERREGLSNTWPVPGGRSQNSSRDNSWNREEHRTSLSSRSSREGDNVMTRSDITLRPTSETSVSHGAAPTSDFDEQGIKKIQPLSEKEMEHKAKTILEEYLNVMDLEEAKLCVKELKGQAYLDVLVSACINDILEKSKQKRAMTGQFFHEMVRNKLIPLDIYLKGLSEVLLVAEDMVIDIPMIWSYLAQLITPMLLGGSVPWSNLVPILKDLNNKCSGKLLAEILLIAKELKGENETALLWQASGLSWSVFMDDSEVDKFLHDKKLDFTSHPVKASLQSKTSLEIFEKITDDMERIAKENGSNAEILAYIEKNVLKDMQQKELIRALTTAVASSSITSTKKPNEEAIKNCIKSRKDVLQQFIKSNVELELQALYAIQALMHKLEHPSNVIVNLFDALYDEDIISDEACKKWEVSNDPQELEGKGACLMQLTQFFAWLKENEDPEPS